MANETMTLISTVTVGAGGAGGIDFTSIPQTYTDLYVIFSGRSAYGAVSQYWVLSLNSSSPSSTKNLYGNGSSVGSNSTNYVDTNTLPGASATSNTFGNASIYIPNYTSSSVKTVSIDAVGENNASGASQGITSMAYSSLTSAITTVSIQAAGQTIVQYSTASLYGILKGSGGATVS